MDRWLVNVRGHQFSVSGLDDLRSRAKKGELEGGDLVQPPGATEWIYALEIPELKKALPAPFEDLPQQSAGMSPAVKGVLMGALAIGAIGGWSYAMSIWDSLPTSDDLELIGGERGMSFSEVLVTASGKSLMATAASSGSEVAPLKKDSRCELMAKRGRWYKLRCGKDEGYAEVDSVVPAYFFGDEKVKADHDPLYNPDRYVKVANSTWMALPEADKTNTTIFNFLIQNDARFSMTSLRLQATIKDQGGQVLQQLEIPVEGEIPPREGVVVGTLNPDKKDKTGVKRIMTSLVYEEMLKTDPKLSERWYDGVQVELQNPGSEASIEIVEVRAVPPEG